MRRLLSLFLAPLFGLGVLLLGPSPAHADDDVPWTITRYEVDATLDADGTTHVRTEFDFDFAGEEGHGPKVAFPERQAVEGNKEIWRLIPVSDIRASSPSGAPAQTRIERESGSVFIYIGDEDVEVNGVQTYVLEYTVAGLPNPRPDGADLDQLAWNVVGPEWEIPLSNITVTVDGPASVTGATCYAGRRDSTAPCDTAESSGNASTFRHPRLDPGNGLTVITDYPAGTLPEGVQQFSKRQTWANSFELSPVSLIGTAVTAVAGFLGVQAIRRGRRDEVFTGVTPGTAPAPGQAATTKKKGRDTIAVRFDPPDERNPGLLGTLIDARVDDRDITATIIDLAVRGYLEIDEIRPRQYRLVKNPNGPDEDLYLHEDALLNGLFAQSNSVDLQEAAKDKEQAEEIADAMSGARTSLYQDSRYLGWFRSNPQALRTGWLVLGLTVAAIGGGGLALLLAPLGLALIAVPVIIGGLALALVSQSMTSRTANGSAMLTQLLGFKEYLETAEADQLRWEEGEDIFSKYLPYAIMFGCADRWSKIFDELRERGLYTVEPSWYHGSNVGYGYGFANGFSGISTAMSDSLSSAMSTAVSTASSGAGGGFAGGVGGGVGGGGGGGW